MKLLTLSQSRSLLKLCLRYQKVSLRKPCITLMLALVHVINFATVKTWQYPQKSVDIATSKCFFSRGNNFVAIETTPNLRCKSDNVLYFVRCLSRRYINAWPSLYPRLAVAVSTPCHRCIHTWPSLYPRLAVAVSTPFRRCIHALYKVFLKMQIQDVAIATPFRRYSHVVPSLYPHLAVAVSTAFHRCIHALYNVFFKMQIQDVAIATPCRLCIHASSSLYPRLAIAVSTVGEI